MESEKIGKCEKWVTFTCDYIAFKVQSDGAYDRLRSVCDLYKTRDGACDNRRQS